MEHALEVLARARALCETMMNSFTWNLHELQEAKHVLGRRRGSVRDRPESSRFLYESSAVMQRAPASPIPAVETWPFISSRKKNQYTYTIPSPEVPVPSSPCPQTSAALLELASRAVPLPLSTKSLMGWIITDLERYECNFSWQLILRFAILALDWLTLQACTTAWHELHRRQSLLITVYVLMSRLRIFI